VITDGIGEFMARDWTAVHIVKDTYWRDRIARLGAAEAFRIADELRRQALAAAPSWPEPDERRDVLSHARPHHAGHAVRAPAQREAIGRGARPLKPDPTQAVPSG